MLCSSACALSRKDGVSSRDSDAGGRASALKLIDEQLRSGASKDVV
jgi:hypothetical protein